MKWWQVFFLVGCFAHAAQEKDDFVTSFVSNYGLSTNARNTRDYHPYIVKRTEESFSLLEKHLKEQNFSLHGRMVVCGYQQEAILPYQTHFDQTSIDDEVSTKTDAGWDFASGNLFGCVTGFLLQNCNQYGSIFEHVAREHVELFDVRSSLLQRHAFGASYDFLSGAQRQVYKGLRAGDSKAVLTQLHTCWKQLYVHGYTDGSGALIATQDILFSLHYAQFILDSALPVTKFFVGPDITYPIEVLSCQKEEATRGAQQFVHRFMRELVPVDDEKTAYIFSSFVDGVGKSTLLGNVINFLQHGDTFSVYQRVDNSSTQQAQLFKVNDKVVIVDLPAQVSHFLAKPDGYVYVDVETVPAVSALLMTRFEAHLAEHAATYEQHFVVLLDQLQNNQELTLDEDDAPEVMYAKNVCIMQVNAFDWIPCSFEGHHFLFDKNNYRTCKVLVPFEGVHSTGLKVTRPEQMLFTGGLLMPMAYDDFLDDVTGQLHDAGVKKVVFVDFMSMYPRSSRENIRVNFLLQQLKGIFASLFDQNATVYQHTVSPQDFYYLLHEKGDQVAHNIALETGMRLSLYTLLQLCCREGIQNVPLHSLKLTLGTLFFNYYTKEEQVLHTVVNQKVTQYMQELSALYSLSTAFESVLLFSPEPLVKFSDFLCTFFGHAVVDVYFNSLWSGLNTPIKKEGRRKNYVVGDIVLLQSGMQVEVVATCTVSCREKIVLAPFIQTVRAHWYAALSNMLLCEQDAGGCWTVRDVNVAVPPLVIKIDNGICYAMRPVLPITNQKGSLPAIYNGAIGEDAVWGIWMNRLHCLDWSGVTTHTNMYGFGYHPCGVIGSLVQAILTEYKQQQSIPSDCALFMPTTDLYACLQLEQYAFAVQEDMQMQKRKQYVTCSRETAQLFVRAVATLEQLIPDAKASIVVRKHNQQDFVTALHLLETLVLPAYFSLECDGPLFNKYDDTKPVIVQ